MTTYRLLERIGAGGMGEVFAAHRILDNGDHSTVALKTMKPELCADAKYRRMFFDEARIGLQISHNHPGLVTVYECITDKHGRSHLIMEWIDGCSLYDIAAFHGRPPWDVLRLIARDVLGALDYLHGNGILHRDISPCNVLVSRAGEVKLSDLGLAKPRAGDGKRSSRFRGKFPYASPEAVRGRRIDERSDLFAFAAVLYEVITGHSPYGEAYDLWGLLRRYVDWRAPALPDDVPADLRALIGGLLQRKPSERRPQNARDALTVLASFGERAARQELASLVHAVRAREQRAPAGLCVGQVIEADAAVVMDEAVDARADTEPEHARAVDSQARTHERSRGERGSSQRTRPGPHGRPRLERQRRAAAIMAAAGLLGLLAAGRYALDRGSPSEPARTTIANEPDMPATPVEREIGPHRLVIAHDHDHATERSTPPITKPMPARPTNPRPRATARAEPPSPRGPEVPSLRALIMR